LRRGRKKLQQLLNDKPRSRWLAGILLPLPEASKIGFGSFKQFIVQLKPMTMYSLSSIVLAGALAIVLPQKFTQDQAQPVVSASIASTLYESITPPVAPSIDRIPTPEPIAAIKKPIKKAVLPTSIHQANVIDTPTLFKNPPALALKSKASIFDTPKKPGLLSHSKPMLDNAQKGCDKRVPRIERMNTLKTRLLKKLSQDGLISSTRAKNKVSFQGKKVLVHDQMIPDNLQSKYLAFLKEYKITPCPERFVATSAAYIAVGKMLGRKKFSGQIKGRLDIADLNYD